MLIALLSMLGLMAIAATMNVGRDMASTVGVYPTNYPSTITANKAKDVGVALIDLDAAMFVVNVGAITGAGLVLPVAQECATLGGTYTDVAAGDLSGAFVNCVANTVQKVGYRGVQPFVAIRFAYISGTNVVAGGMIEGRYGHVRPVA